MLNRLLKALLPLVVVGAAVMGAYVMIVNRPPVETRTPVVMRPAVRVQQVAFESVDLTVASQGTVQPRTASQIVPEIAGTVIEVSPAFAVGGFFEAGDVLLELDPYDYQQALIAGRSQLAQAQLRLAQEEAEAEVARREWEELGRGDASALTLREPQVEEARAAVASAEAAIDRARRDLERAAVRAPYAGRVQSKDVDVGQFVNRGTPVGRIYAVDSAEVRLPLPDEELAYVDVPLSYRGARQQAGPAVTLSADFAGRRYTWQGRIVRTEGEIDPMSRMVHVVAEVADPYAPGPDPTRPPLAVGMFVEAEIAGRRVDDVVVLPWAALHGRDRVLIVDADGRLRYRQVEVLRSTTESVLVSGGLEEGERVSISALDTVVDGMAVQVAGGEPAMARADAAADRGPGAAGAASNGGPGAPPAAGAATAAGAASNGGPGAPPAAGAVRNAGSGAPPAAGAASNGGRAAIPAAGAVRNAGSGASPTAAGASAGASAAPGGGRGAPRAAGARLAADAPTAAGAAPNGGRGALPAAVGRSAAGAPPAARAAPNGGRGAPPAAVGRSAAGAATAAGAAPNGGRGVPPAGGAPDSRRASARETVRPAGRPSTPPPAAPLDDAFQLDPSLSRQEQIAVIRRRIAELRAGERTPSPAAPARQAAASPVAPDRTAAAPADPRGAARPGPGNAAGAAPAPRRADSPRGAGRSGARTGRDAPAATDTPVGRPSMQRPGGPGRRAAGVDAPVSAPPANIRPARAAAARADAAPPAGAAAPVVALLPFRNVSRNPADDIIGEEMQAVLRIALERAAGMRVVLLAPGDESNAIQRATANDATWLAGGGYQRVGEQLRVTGRVVDVATGDLLGSVRVDGTVAGRDALTSRLIAALRAELAGTMPATAASRPARTAPPDARRPTNPAERRGLLAAAPPRTAPAPGLARPAPSAVRIAVSPFANISRNPADDAISDRVAAEMASRLGRLPAAEVLALAAGDADGPAAVSVAAARGADWLVTGGYQHVDGRLRLTARLLQVSDGALVESVKVDGSVDALSDVLTEALAALGAALAASS